MTSSTILLTKEFVFDAAHQLDWHNGKCKNLHGHTYKLQVTIGGNLNKDGVLFDFGDLKNIVNNKVINLLDHHYLNEIIN